MKLEATGKADRGELTEAGKLYEDLRTAIAIKSESAYRAAWDALQAYRTRTGTHGQSLRAYADGAATPARASRPSTPTAAVRASSGGSTVLADIAAIRGQIAEVRRSAALAQLEARRRQQQQRTQYTDDGGRIEYDDDAFDDMDFEVVVSEEEQRQQMHSLIG